MHHAKMKRTGKHCLLSQCVILIFKIFLVYAVEPGKEVMSRSTTCTFTCSCGKVFNSPIYEYVNTAHDPQLQYTVLAGLLNVSRCPACGRRAVLSRPFIYSDPSHGLLAYVHPSEDVPEVGRELIRRKLEDVYAQVVLYSAPSTGGYKGPRLSQHHPRPYEDCEQSGYEDFRPYADYEQPAESLPLRDQQLHVVFGLEQLYQLINATLSQDERLGRLALSTYSRREAVRGQLLDIARKFAAVMQCQVDVEEQPHAYIVWLYGSRRQIGAIMRELAP